MKIKAIFFDYGGVFNREGQIEPFFDYCSQKYGKQLTSEFQMKSREIWESLRIGDLSKEKYFEFIGSFFGVHEKEIIKDIMYFFGNNHEIYEFALQLKKSYKIGMITNQIEEWFKNITHHYELDEIFDSIVTSYDCGFAKPSLEIYKYALSEIGLKPEECVFVDDIQANVDAASSIGMQGILYENMEKLKQDLKNILG